MSAISNRAACLLAMGKLQECSEDCTRALDLLEVGGGIEKVKGVLEVGGGGR